MLCYVIVGFNVPTRHIIGHFGDDFTVGLVKLLDFVLMVQLRIYSLTHSLKHLASGLTVHGLDVQETTHADVIYYYYFFYPRYLCSRGSLKIGNTK